jgi:hypothetical protein
VKPEAIAPSFRHVSAGYLQKQVAPEEDAARQALLGPGEMHVGLEVGQRETDVRSVYVANDVDEDDDRQDMGPSLHVGQPPWGTLDQRPTSL